MKPHTAPHVVFIPCADDVLHALAQHLCTQHAQQLPDLSTITILLPDLTVAPRLRKALLLAARDRGQRALLGPTIITPRTWVSQLAAVPTRSVSGYARELLLTEALVRFPYLYGKASPWSLTESLLRLFDEFTLHRCAPPGDGAVFQAHLAEAYGIQATTPQALSREASLVHTLWQAWHEQLDSLNSIDPQSAYLTQLALSISQIQPGTAIYVAGFGSFCAAEATWLQSLAANFSCTVLLHGGGAELKDNAAHTAVYTLCEQLGVTCKTAAPAAARSAFIDAAFASTVTPLAERARNFSARYPASPLAENTLFYAAHSAEEEACAIDIQVRRWLLDGAQSIGIVTENRRLARRVRALLERAGITLDDLSGWALSTTSAASTLERWLEAIEEDFAYEPLLDILKSAFVFPDIDRHQRLNAVYRLEEDIIRNENVARNLERYRRRLHLRRARLPGEWGASYDAVDNILDRLQHAAEPFANLIVAGARKPRVYLHALRASLLRLGMEEAWSMDDAGRRLLQELELLQSAAETSTLSMTWLEFRFWLGRALEMYNFSLPSVGSRVQLLSLNRSALARFDAVIIASCEQEHLPGAENASPFFNDSVRAELGLPTAENHRASSLHQFRCVLECALRVLLTRVHECDGEEVIASPWWDSMLTFHQLAYGSALADPELASLTSDPRAQISENTTVALPAPEQIPRPRIDPNLLPQTITAHSYQTLMDCPYQFFAAQCLKLAPAEIVREALQKDDFGTRIHLCLQAFHTRTSGLPEPFTQPFVATHRDAAIAHLEKIARVAFGHDLDDNFRHRGWLKRFLVVVPHYIDWQIEHAQRWGVHQVELKQQRATSGLTLRGRIDRIDLGAEGLGIIDYKTGSVPRRDEVLCGESVQLPYYALLVDDSESVVTAEYVVLGTDTVRSAIMLEGEILHPLRAQVGERLITVMQQLRQGQQAPAWGDPITCQRCTMEGLCRRSAWASTEIDMLI